MTIPKPFDIIAAAIIAMYIIQLANSLLFRGQLSQLGIVPREVRGLLGIVNAPLLHGGFLHLLSNTLPLAVLAGVVLSRSAAAFGLVTAAGVLVAGGATWLLARRSVHIGASGLVYSYFGYLLFSSWFEHAYVLFFLVVWIVFGRLIRGLLPQGRGISFEGHLFGFAAGALVAWTHGSWAAQAKVLAIGRAITLNHLSMASMTTAILASATITLAIAQAVREKGRAE
ncbi:MAG TPA: rhomboid family intramembrane serine protease [Capsulimonadaceae bacterium]|jgi:membrane associated rhomboid family serine protease